MFLTGFISFNVLIWKQLEVLVFSIQMFVFTGEAIEMLLSVFICCRSGKKQTCLLVFNIDQH